MSGHPSQELAITLREGFQQAGRIIVNDPNMKKIAELIVAAGVMEMQVLAPAIRALRQPPKP